MEQGYLRSLFVINIIFLSRPLDVFYDMSEGDATCADPSVCSHALDIRWEHGRKPFDLDITTSKHYRSIFSRRRFGSQRRAGMLGIPRGCSSLALIDLGLLLRHSCTGTS